MLWLNLNHVSIIGLCCDMVTSDLYCVKHNDDIGVVTDKDFNREDTP